MAWIESGSCPGISRPSSGAWLEAGPLRRPLRNLPCSAALKGEDSSAPLGMPAAGLKRQLAEARRLFQGGLRGSPRSE